MRRTRDRDAHAAAIEAVVGGRHGDPFSFLGMHGPDGRGDMVVRTFQPDATAVTVIDLRSGTETGRLERVHAAGFFEGAAGRGGRYPYRLRVEYASGAIEVEDPYRFAPILGDVDIHLLAEGTHLQLHDKLGAHPMTVDGVAGVAFALWAPNARRVSVVGDFNQWDGRRHPMRLRHGPGVWELFIPGLAPGGHSQY